MTLLELQDAITEALREHDGSCEVVVQATENARRREAEGRVMARTFELEPLYAHPVPGAVETCFVIQCREL